MENSLKGLILAAGIVITCMVIGVGFYVSRESKSTSMKATSQIQEMTSDIDNPKLMVYDGAKVTGSEVLWIMDHIACNRTPVYVQTLNGQKLMYQQTEGYYQFFAPDKNQRNHINPNAIFIGEAVRNSNGVVSCLSFCQEGAVPSDLWYDLSYFDME